MIAVAGGSSYCTDIVVVRIKASAVLEEASSVARHWSRVALQSAGRGRGAATKRPHRPVRHKELNRVRHKPRDSVLGLPRIILL